MYEILGYRDKDKSFSLRKLKELNEAIIVYSNEWMKDARFTVAVKYYHNELEKPFIIVDDMYMELDQAIKEFVILHEIGHIKSKGNMDSNTNYFSDRSKFTRNGKIHPAELNADLYALRHMEMDNKDKFINGLHRMKHQLPFIAQKEWDLRIENMKKYLGMI